MKKIFYLIILIILLRLPVMAQTVIWSENFSNPPTDWTTDGNWAFDLGDLIFYYYPIVENYDFSAISSEIQIPATTSELSLSQFIDPYLTGVTNETCEIWVLSEGEEVLIFSYGIINGAWGEMNGTTFSHSLDQFEGKTVQLKFRTWGASTYALWGWAINNVSISSTFENELSALEVSGQPNIFPGATGTWQFSIKNVGQLPQSDFITKLFNYKTGEQLSEVQYSGNLNAGETAIVDFQWSPQDYQNTSLYGVVESANDEFQANNRSKGFFVRVEPPISYNVLVWDNDNGIPTIYNDETGQEEGANAGIEKALTQAGIPYDLVHALPEDISGYNIILCTMGSYCLS